MKYENQTIDEKKQTSPVIIILVAILSIVVGIVLGILINGQLNNSESKIESENNVGTTDSVKEENSFSISEIVFGGLAITYNGEVYINIGGSNGLMTVNNVYGEGTYQILSLTMRDKYQSYTFENLDYVNNDNNKHEFVGLKLSANNVKAVYTFNRGQSIPKNASLILLHEDNTLSIISIYSLINGKTDVTKINNLNNITGIIHGATGGIGGGAETFAVTASGEQINLAQYIPEDYLSF